MVTIMLFRIGKEKSKWEDYFYRKPGSSEYKEVELCFVVEPLVGVSRLLRTVAL